MALYRGCCNPLELIISMFRCKGIHTQRRALRFELHFFGTRPFNRLRVGVLSLHQRPFHSVVSTRFETQHRIYQILIPLVLVGPGRAEPKPSRMFELLGKQSFLFLFGLESKSTPPLSIRCSAKVQRSGLMET